MAKIRGLGKGLDALLAGGGSTGEDDTLQQLAVDLLVPGKYQPRTRMDPDALQELADSIRAQGLMQPVLVRPLPNLRYEIIAGERRWRAAQLAGLSQIDCLVREVADEATMAMALIENIQREDLNPLEEARGIERLIGEFKLTHEQAASALGRSRPTVSNLLRLTQLPESAQELMLEGALDMGHARALLALEPEQQAAAAAEVAKRRWSVRQTEDWVKRQLQSRPEPETSAPEWQELEKQLSARLGQKVEIKANRQGKGRLILHFVDAPGLQSWVHRLLPQSES